MQNWWKLSFNYQVPTLSDKCLTYISENLSPEEEAIVLHMGHDDLHSTLHRLLEILLPSQFSHDYGIRLHYSCIALFAVPHWCAVVVHIQFTLLLLLSTICCQRKRLHVYSKAQNCLIILIDWMSELWFNSPVNHIVVMANCLPNDRTHRIFTLLDALFY